MDQLIYSKPASPTHHKNFLKIGSISFLPLNIFGNLSFIHYIIYSLFVCYFVSGIQIQKKMKKPVHFSQKARIKIVRNIFVVVTDFMSINQLPPASHDIFTTF